MSQNITLPRFLSMAYFVFADSGTLSFREIEQSYLPTYSRHWDNQAKVPWLYSKQTKTMITIAGGSDRE
jgi:hypothetical protein